MVKIKLILVLLLSLVSTLACSATFPVLSALVNKDSVVLTWDAPLGVVEISHYEMFYGPESSEADAVKINAGKDTTLTIDNLAPGVWEFAVRVVDISGIESELSNIVTTEIVFKTRPLASVLSGRVK